MKKEKFIKFLIKEKCIGFFEEPIKLSSGEESSWYINLRELQSNLSKLDKFTDFIVEFVNKKKIEGPFVGVPESATLPAIRANEKLGYKDFIFLRQKLKSHGISGRFPYSLSPIDISGREYTLLEDTLTTGDSAILTTLHLLEGGAKVKSIIVVCYREDKRWGGLFPHEYIKKHLRIPVYTMTRARDILPLAIKELNPSKEVIESLKKEYSTHEEIYKILNNLS